MLVLALVLLIVSSAVSGLDLFEATVPDLSQALESGEITSKQLVQKYIERINSVNDELRPVIEINPDALEIAEQLDKEREEGEIRGPLHGIPILIKANIATLDKMQTTSGSTALVGSEVPRDSFVVRKLRKAGAIILGKSNLSEWAYFRSDNNTNGWSACGGQTVNPYAENGDPCGSSSGSAVSVAIGLSPVAIGTETDGSIACPSASNNIVGLKPTVGLVSRNGIVPISELQDSAGPMGKSVYDVALVLNAIVGIDKRDPATAKSKNNRLRDYTKVLKTNALKGARIGIPREVEPFADTPEDWLLFKKSIRIMKNMGAIIVDVEFPNFDEFVNLTGSDVYSEKLEFEFKYAINKYLASLVSIPTHADTLAGLIKFNKRHAAVEFPPFEGKQEIFIASQQTTNLEDPTYIEIRDQLEFLAGENGIDAVVRKYNVDAIALPESTAVTTTYPAIAGYPLISVPNGFFDCSTSDNCPAIQEGAITKIGNYPRGLVFFGPAWSEPTLLALAYSYEQKTKVRAKYSPIPLVVPSK